jgi:tetratricopeptide (TPR) repeat protein
MNEAPKTKSGWRIVRRILIALAVLATLVAIFYTEEDWRGKRDWENYKHEWEAKGEKFDWQSFVPPTVPDDQNFFCAPIFTNMLDGKIVMNSYHSDASPNFPTFKDLPSNEFGYLGGEGRARITDLRIWQASYRHPANEKLANEFPIAPQPQTPAKDVLLALSKYDSAIEALRQASQRPYASVPLNYEDGFDAASTLLPYLATIKRCTQVLQLRVVAELADGQNENALADIKLMLYLNNSLHNSPFLISHLVRMAIVAVDLQTIWEGLAEHKWSDEQLVTLEAELGKLDFLADYEFAMRGERAFAIATFENQQRTREIISGFVAPQGNSSLLVTNKLTFMPSAFFYQNELAVARMQQQWILPLVDTNSRTVSPEKLQQANDADRAEMKHYSPYKVQALMLFPAIGRAVEKFAAIQSSIDLARVACALERYRLAHGEYPETLNVLAPQFIEKLPHDIIGGQPLHYRRETNGQFILYSVGWNETDDGGVVAFTKGTTPRVDRDKGDWVWEYPQK